MKQEGRNGAAAGFTNPQPPGEEQQREESEEEEDSDRCANVTEAEQAQARAHEE